ncbi:MAG: dihydroxyacetone kinase subunit DhaL [Desulfobacterales bacterium]
MIEREDLLAWMKALQKVFTQNKAYLTDLDAAIGDADHGINMERGFNAVAAELEKSRPADIAGILKTVAMTLIKTVGGASGPLYGTLFLRAAAVCAGKDALEPADVVALFSAGLEGVVQRGKAGLNDKTMVDALTPAAAAMKTACEAGADLNMILQQGTTAAQDGMQRTVEMQARKGRASYLGVRSIGHQDPGATSSFLLLKAAADTWET